MYKLIAILCLALLPGCGGNVKPVACTGVDWDDLGYTTAMNGDTIRTFDAYRDSCGRNLEDGAMDGYLTGFTKGVMEYCTYENGFAIGVKNGSSKNSCPAEIRSPFIKGYNLGYADFTGKLKRLDSKTEETDLAEKTPDRASPNQ